MNAYAEPAARAAEPSRGRRPARAYGLLLLICSLILLSACNSGSGNAGTDVPPPDIRETPDPPDEELAALVQEMADRLHSGVGDLLVALEAGSDTEEVRADLVSTCVEAAAEFKDANMAGVVEIRDVCREINTNTESEDTRFWQDVSARLEPLKDGDLETK